METNPESDQVPIMHEEYWTLFILKEKILWMVSWSHFAILHINGVYRSSMFSCLFLFFQKKKICFLSFECYFSLYLDRSFKGEQDTHGHWCLEEETQYTSAVADAESGCLIYPGPRAEMCAHAPASCYAFVYLILTTLPNNSLIKSPSSSKAWHEDSFSSKLPQARS